MVKHFPYPAVPGPGQRLALFDAQRQPASQSASQMYARHENNRTSSSFHRGRPGSARRHPRAPGPVVESGPRSDDPQDPITLWPLPCLAE